MPADDLVLNVRQIGNYPDAGTVENGDTLLMQRGGLGGAYASIEANDLVSTGLLYSIRPLQVGFAAPADAIGAQIFTAAFSMAPAGGWLWNAYVSTSGHQQRIIAGQPAAAQVANPTEGWTWDWGPAGGLGADIPFVRLMTLSPTGDLTLAGQLVLGGGLQAATTQWVEMLRAQSVTSFNMRFGDIMLTVDDIICAGGAPIYSPRFMGSPRAETPPPWSNSSRVATTGFVQTVIQEWTGNLAAYAPLDSPAFVGVPTAPTAPIGSSDGTIATTAFVINAVSESTTGVSSFNTRTGAVVLAGPDISAAGAALLASPAFTGVPTAPTAAPATSTTQLATTAFVMAAVAGGTAGVASFNTRTGAVVLTTADVAAVGVSAFNGRIGAVTLLNNDISAAGGALLAGPAFSGVPTAPTAAPTTNTTQIATTGFVQAALVGVGGVLSFNTRSGAVALTTADVTAVGAALLASPAFTGVPTAPTAAPATSTTQLATTAFVMAAIAAGVAGVASFNGRTGAVTLITADVSGVGGALLASPTFSGVPAGPTAAVGTSTTQLATTAFVMTAAATTNPVMDGTAAVGTGTRWARNDHVHPSDTSKASLSGAVFTGAVQAPALEGVSNGAINIDMGTGLFAGCGGMTFNIPGLPATSNLGFGWSTSPPGTGSLQVLVDQSIAGYLVRSLAVTGSTFGVTLMQLQGSVTSMSVVADGPTTASWSVAPSDRRLKRNIARPGKDALALVNDIKVSQCDFAHPTAVGSGEHWDFTLVADEVQAVLPYAYMPPPPDGFASLHPLHLITTLWRAVQQLSQRLEALEARTT